MSSGGQRSAGECKHGHYQRYNDFCKDCRIEELEREVAAALAERDAAVAEAVRRERENWIKAADQLAADIRRGE